MRSYFVLLYLFFVQGMDSQPPISISSSYGNPKNKGYYFLVPYGTSSKATNKIMLLVLNGKGEVVHYKYVPFASDFKRHNNGKFSYWNGRKFCLLNKSLDIIDSVGCVNNIVTDSHDFLILKNGDYVLIGKQVITVDLSAKKIFNKKRFAGSKNAKVQNGVIQILNKKKELIYQWNSEKYFKPEDASFFYLTDSVNVDVSHFNSVSLDSDGNLLISARYFDQVLKVSRKTGEVMWRLGGKTGDVKVMNDTVPFYGQHDARFFATNKFSLFDNGYTFDSLKHNARAIEYELDEKTKTAKVIRNYSNENRIISEATGNVQKLDHGTILINYGKIQGWKNNITFEVITIKGQKLFLGAFRDTLGSYRTYYHGRPNFKIELPKIKSTKKDTLTCLTTRRKYKYYFWSTGEETPSINASKPGKYHVFISNDGVLFSRSKSDIIIN
ncbi:MAG: aryl-sulfate sulfotransferase [Bacteroidia bacterium]|nr:aryl-sulfate sulfotransferase [Bacteroidia bacterium]